MSLTRMINEGVPPRTIYLKIDARTFSNTNRDALGKNIVDIYEELANDNAYYPLNLTFHFGYLKILIQIKRSGNHERFTLDLTVCLLDKMIVQQKPRHSFLCPQNTPKLF